MYSEMNSSLGAATAGRVTCPTIPSAIAKATNNENNFGVIPLISPPVVQNIDAIIA